jgi:hypothetical protein
MNGSNNDNNSFINMDLNVMGNIQALHVVAPTMKVNYWCGACSFLFGCQKLVSKRREISKT